ncbi:hypothetical protein HYG81_18710 [Natrinema zhouii]|uniref:hypothetical protein n=1 Tax=Natrinema zhouii TaxID=1710539 RepID=UPI001CFFD78A|nr:hypothetical protein [Natrinema zhouii]UHQ97968.1 hypothetical protein HYG81_18710 [Natrinema zhouii]
MTEKTETRIPCARETLRSVRRLKTGDESWDSLLRKMADCYQPEEYPRGEFSRDPNGDRE